MIYFLYATTEMQHMNCFFNGNYLRDTNKWWQINNVVIHNRRNKNSDLDFAFRNTLPLTSIKFQINKKCKAVLSLRCGNLLIIIPIMTKNYTNKSGVVSSKKNTLIKINYSCWNYIIIKATVDSIWKKSSDVYYNFNPKRTILLKNDCIQVANRRNSGFLFGLVENPDKPHSWPLLVLCPFFILLSGSFAQQ